MRNVMFFAILCVVCFSGGSAFGASVSDGWSLGDINGGFSTYSYPNGKEVNTQMSMYVDSYYKITSSSIYIYPYYNYAYDNDGNILSKVQQGYVINGYIGGEISKLLETGSLSQSNWINARGISIDENSYINTYDTFSKDGSSSLYSNAGSNISILNFDVRYGYGNYNEYSYGGSGRDSKTYFGYNVNWYGDFLPGKGPTMPIIMGTSVPEPAMISMLCMVAVGGFVYWRKKR